MESLRAPLLEGPPSALQKCTRCKTYFTFDTETKQPSVPCRFHPKRFTAFGGVTPGVLAGYWRCCGASRQHAPGCSVLTHHVQDEHFLDMTVEYTYADREDADVKAWPPLAAAQGSAPADDGGPPGKKGVVLPEDWIEVRVTRSDTVSSLAVKYGTNPVMLRLVNKLSSDMMLMSRRSVLVPPDRSVAPPPPMTEDELRDQAVRRLRKRMGGAGSLEEARFYLDAAGGDLDAALADYEADRAWERTNSGGLAKGKAVRVTG
mmetsp:Transcript_2435/g.6128  ORF Transcript_2435/g.6128 Transcript_2435/m.6128 type:complete len:261 (+) Transcript_2435:135-917(+)